MTARLSAFLNAHPQLFGYCLLAAFGVVLAALATVSVFERNRSERWRDWATRQRPRRF